jgi:phosphoribosylanthranilate isomerase
MLRVKICGLTRELDVSFAILAGADAVGFIVGFPSSMRNITMEHAALLSRKVPPFVDAVLVAPAETVMLDVGLKGGKFDAIQLYGQVSDPDAIRRATGSRVIRAYQAKTDDPAAAKAAAKGFDALLTDTYDPKALGGTGVPADWSICKNIKYAVSPTPMILSGGLNAGNVATAVQKVHPFAVDVSSGVESAPGVKDPGKVMEFIKKAKESDW